MPRPLIQLGVADLEGLFSKSKTDIKVLKQLEHELQDRQVPRAVALLAEVQAAMYGAATAAPAPAPSKPAPAPAPQQTGLWERPTTPVTRPAAAPIATPRPPEPIKAPAPSAITKTPPPALPTMPVEDAYKLLKATAGSTWESIEQTRRTLVQQSHPDRLKGLSADKRSKVLADAKMLNAAYERLSRSRCAAQ